MLKNIYLNWYLYKIELACETKGNSLNLGY